jgi:hypothetical protein
MAALTQTEVENIVKASFAEDAASSPVIVYMAPYADVFAKAIAKAAMAYVDSKIPSE